MFYNMLCFSVDKAPKLCDNQENNTGRLDFMRKVIALILVLTCTLCLFTGCSEMSDIAGNVMDAAREELVNQIKAKVEEYKVSIVETKTAVGKLNDDGGQYQFFCAFLVQTNTESSAEDCANAIASLFGNAHYMAQNGSQVQSEYLIHKTITYDHTDFSAGNYYTIYVYAEDLTSIVIPGGLPNGSGDTSTEDPNAANKI